MAKVEANGLQLEYETHGDPTNPALVVIRGLGTQMIGWTPEFLQGLVGKGLFVVTFDNRDVGLSEKIGDDRVPDIPELIEDVLAGRAPDVPYTLHDMAADVIGLMDGLEIDKAHILGMSMGGMIAQLVVGTYPDRALSLTSIMSSTGDRSLPPATDAAMRTLNERPKSGAREDIIENAVKSNKVNGSAAGVIDEDEVLYARAAAAYDRCYYPKGYLRQYAAIVATGDRSEILKTITAPTLVIHGRIDPLVPLAHGEDTAHKIPGARLEVIEGMGHDLPLKLSARISELITDHVLAGALV
ncbi:MAG: alpha/beta hydrolase [Alphaproteobacteria bacterium]|nr:MAG: alpha/beta hydrolase [Alphaproteobacteria bacterium]